MRIQLPWQSTKNMNSSPLTLKDQVMNRKCHIYMEHTKEMSFHSTMETRKVHPVSFLITSLKGYLKQNALCYNLYFSKTGKCNVSSKRRGRPSEVSTEFRENRALKEARILEGNQTAHIRVQKYIVSNPILIPLISNSILVLLVSNSINLYSLLFLTVVVFFFLYSFLTLFSFILLLAAYLQKLGSPHSFNSSTYIKKKKRPIPGQRKNKGVMRIQLPQKSTKKMNSSR